MTKQLSDCCKAGIKLTGKERPNHFACEKCDRIIGTPIDTKTEEVTNYIEEAVKDFNQKFPLPKVLALSGGKGVERDAQINWIRTRFKSLATKIYEDVEREAKDEDTNHQINIHTARLASYLQQIQDTGQARCAEMELEKILKLSESHIATYAREKINRLSK